MAYLCLVRPNATPTCSLDCRSACKLPAGVAIAAGTISRGRVRKCVRSIASRSSKLRPVSRQSLSPEGPRSVAIHFEPTLETVQVAQRSPNCVPLGVSRKRSRYVSEPIEIYYCPLCQKEVEDYWQQRSNQSMKPTAPFRNALSVLATTPWISSRCPASLVRFASLRSRTPAVMLSNASRGLSLSR